MKKILIVDDNQDILEPLLLLLEGEGYDVQVISKGEEVAEAIVQFRPHLILLDIFLSGLDGREICLRLKSDTKTGRIPIIMMSAHPAAKTTISRCHADDFIAKPFEISHLLTMVEKHIA